MVQLFLSKISDFVYKRYLLVLLFAFLLTGVSGYLASKLEFKSNFQDLLPDHFSSVKVLKEVTKKIGGIGYVTVIIHTEDIPQGEKYTAAIAKEVEKVPEIRFVDHRVDVDFFKDRMLLYLDTEDLHEILRRFERKRAYEKKMMNPFYIDLEDENVKLDFSDIEKKYQESNINANNHGFYVAKDKKTLLLLAKPKGLASDLNYARKVVADVKQAVARVDPKLYHDSISIEFTDRYVIMPIQNDAIKADLSRTSILSLFGVILLITFYTRRKRAILLIGVPLVMGVVWAFGFAYIAIGYVNLVTGFLSAILLGLGIDFGIHLFSRYLEDRRKGTGLQTSINNVICLSGRACFTAAITSAVAFFALVFTEFRGFSQFGVIAGFGLLSCYLAMIFVLPSLILVFERRYPVGGTPKQFLAQRIKFKIPRKSLFPRTIVVLSIIIFLIVAANLRLLSFEYNFKNLQVRDLRELELQDVANETMGISLTPNAILAKDFDEVREITKIMEDHKKEIIASGKGSAIDKVASLLTSIPDGQDEKLKIIKRIEKISKDKVFKYLRGKQAKVFNDAKKILNPSKVTLENLPIEVRRVFTGIDDTNSRLMWIFPGVLLWNGREAMKFVREIRYVNEVKKEPIDISGETFIMADMLDLIKKDGLLAIVLTLITVFGILLIDFRSLIKAITVMSPLVCGVFCMFGIMIIFDIKVNFLNVVMFPAIIGLGVDNGVHLYHRYQEGGYRNVVKVLQSTGSAVLLSSLTTMVGFGSLIIARHKGLNSIGILAIIGIASCLLSSVIFFPSLLQLIEDRRMKQEG